MAPLGSSKTPSGVSYSPMPTTDVRAMQMMETEETGTLQSIDEAESDDSQSLLTEETGQYTARSQASREGFSKTPSYAALSSDEEDGMVTPVSRSRSRSENFKWRDIRKGTFGGVTLAVLMGLAAWFGIQLAIRPSVTGSPESVQNSGGIMNGPQLRNLLVNEIQPLMSGKTGSEIALGVNQTLNRLQNIVVKRLPQEQRDALEQNQVETRTWSDIARLIRAMRDPRIKELGRETFEMIRNSSVFEDPEALSLKIVNRLRHKGEELNSLRKELIPHSFTEALDRWSKENLGTGSTTETHSKAWRGMLDPSITRLMRGNGTIEIDMTEGREKIDMTEGRRLNMGTWAHPVLNGFELTIGITTVVLIAAMEIMIHIEIFNSKFSMPTWAWMMVIMPAQTVGVWTCVTGLSIWCDLVFGALGLNVLDAFYVLIRMR